MKVPLELDFCCEDLFYTDIPMGILKHNLLLAYAGLTFLDLISLNWITRLLME